MKTPDNGGPAFPKSYQFVEDGEIMEEQQSGMSVRTAIAMRAPQKAPVWFSPKLEKEPKITRWQNCEGTRLYDDWKVAKFECGHSVMADPEQWKEVRRVRERNNIASLVQWPVFYADALIAELTKDGGVL